MKMTMSIVGRFTITNTIILSWLLVNVHSAKGRNAPEVLSTEKVRNESSASDALWVDGLAFYQGKLYAGTGVGLLQISNGFIEKIYRWDKASTEVIVPCHDEANESLWGEVLGLWRLVCYDGKRWRTVNRPKPKHGYIARGEELEGFRFVSGRRNLYWQGAGHAWAWTGSKWIEEDNPPTKTNKKNPVGLLDRLIAADDHLYFVMKNERYPNRLGLGVSMRNGERLGGLDPSKGNSVYYFAKDQWNLVTNKTTYFLSEETAAANDKGYIRTTKGDLLEVTKAGIVKNDTPGKCEAIVTSATGTLLASFQGKGVFELKDRWEKLLSSPCPDSETDHRAYLAATVQQIALAIEPRAGRSAQKPKGNSRFALWISDGHEWRPVVFP
jgi:hypothetical protein